MKKYITAVFILSIISTQTLSQKANFNITKIDSSQTFYSKIQSEIKFKNLGIFRDTIYGDNGVIFQIIRYENLISKTSQNDIWTIIDKYEFDQKGLVQKSEHWKTDNKGKMCKCDSWQLDRKGFFVKLQWHPKCKKKGFDCDNNGIGSK